MKLFSLVVILALASSAMAYYPGRQDPTPPGRLGGIRREIYEDEEEDCYTRHYEHPCRFSKNANCWRKKISYLCL